MTYISVRDFRNNAARVFKRLQEEGLPQVVLRRSKPVAVLLPADEDAAEAVRLYRLVRAQLAVRAIREEARQRGLNRMSSKEIDDLIARTRAQGRP